jgi:putative iron-dependent peroxidase
MADVQPGILAPPPRLARYLFFVVAPAADPRSALRALRDAADGDRTVVGLGESLVRALGGMIEGLGTFPPHVGPGFEVPSTPAALWCWLRGDDRGELLHRARAIEASVAPAFRLVQTIDAFQYGASRDLTGYEDGTENPKAEAAVETAVVSGRGDGLDGGSFVVVQQWVHDLAMFDSMTAHDQDNAIGRRKSDNEELEDAPPSAHVKRTAQESFDPPAFILRRSMPWADEHRAGLVFVAFGKSFDAYDALLRRMVGAEDGIPDALFAISRPVSGGYFWCPPLEKGRLDLRALGL